MVIFEGVFYKGDRQQPLKRIGLIEISLPKKHKT